MNRSAFRFFVSQAERRITIVHPGGEQTGYLLRNTNELVGTDAAQRKAWLHSHNRALNARPADLLERADGLVAVLAYLDAMRAPA